MYSLWFQRVNIAGENFFTIRSLEKLEFSEMEIMDWWPFALVGYKVK